MNIVWFSWKDRSHPLAGGAETVSGEIMDRLARDGHSVKLITSFYPGALEKQIISGTETIRSGGRYSVYFRARHYFKQNLSDWADIVIDEMNTMPFATAFYSNSRNILLTYQLARRVWFYQMTFPFSIIGYLVEPLYLRVLARKYATVLTESESTKQDLKKYGFHRNVHIFRVGMSLEPVTVLSKKADMRTVLSLGAIRPMKRTLHAIKAFEVARDNDTNLHMIIAGDTNSDYAHRVLSYIKESRHSEAIDVRGRVSNDERLKLMRQASVILVTSVKEGWGLIVTEANSQGTPAIVYDTDGLRDSVRDHITGLIVPNGDFASMGAAISSLLKDPATYEALQESAWQWSKEFTFENSYRDFIKMVSDKALL